MRLDEHYHRECEAALAPVIAQIESTDKDARYHRGPVKGLARMNEKLAEYVGDHQKALAKSDGKDDQLYRRA